MKQRRNNDVLATGQCAITRILWSAVGVQLLNFVISSRCAATEFEYFQCYVFWTKSAVEWTRCFGNLPWSYIQWLVL